MTTVITAAEAKVIQKRLNRYEKATKKFIKPNGWKIVPAEAGARLKARGLDVTNDERSRLEVYLFVTDPPEKYFAYVYEIDGVPASITTWTGEIIGRVTTVFRTHRSGFGDKRVNFRAKMIDGRTYSGTFYKSAGDYCRLKVFKKGGL
jgi:hypothetical protein